MDTMFLRSAALSEAGTERDLNEDCIYDETNLIDNGRGRPPTPIGLYIVCDGLGGHQAGEVASQLAVQTVAAELAPILRSRVSDATVTRPDHIRSLYPQIRQQTLAAVLEANARVRQQGEAMSAEEKGRMGTTITLVLVVGYAACFAHVGDSRAYIWQAGRVRQLTRDHTLAAKLAEKGIISEVEIATHPRNNILSRAIGQWQAVTVDIFEWPLQPGDRLLLCSDGLWKAFPDPDELTEWLGAGATPADICWCLVDEARSRDGSDDTSAVVVFVGEQPGSRHRTYYQDEAVPVRDAIALPV